ncbi:hypothetical protein AGABI2DRAFT_200589 [Agaricus bisporus var. bisporus H97]|uniref:hypothetical protein n=1 Tax=Agaricus bisporus var. bisporus (strain H97 / ATCC MYA-4626 / FGSC 10389) TaxID=936046 RepID=UPI00029F577D|nr:hypothetical protein AGABI2DRAFT_200589 [Agaricus bisporus var. bisporus H97]EKV50703.1 hypothetical protein AGABI2DRAFT_200589 [Agaricus bisporus var. bisporus H97]
MTNEESPLLHTDVYDRFSPQKKRLLSTIVIWGGLVAFFTSSTFVPSIPQISRDLNTTGEVVGYAVSVYTFAASVGGLVGSRYAKFYGRRPVYLCGFPLMVIASLAVARASTVTQLLVWRGIQGIGAAPNYPLGAGVIGDIYRLEERGTALGTYFGFTFLGIALGPSLGGIIAHYWSWRAIHYLLACFGCAAFVFLFIFFPETSHPGTRGMDEYARSGKALPKWRPCLLNPFSQLLLLRSPNILAVAISSAVTVITDLALLVPFAYTIGKRYGIDNEALIGLCFLPLGIGNALGAPLSGRLSDKVVIKYKEMRGYWYPEDRLRAAFFGAFLPFPILASALITKYVSGPIGLTLNLVCLFISGIGCDLVMTPGGAYVVDVLQANSAGATAAVNSFRWMLTSFQTAMLLPMINTYGHLVTNSVISLLVVFGFMLTALTIAYGKSMRAFVDVGYPTT